MSTSVAVVLSGDLTADGTVKLDTKPTLRPGRVRIILEPITETESANDRFPEPPWLDESIPAPLDLPHFGKATRVQPRPASHRLPEPCEWTGEIPS